MANTAYITSSASAPDGVFFMAPVGTPMPANAVEDLHDAFQDLGIVNSEGVVQTPTRDTEKIEDYGGSTIYTLQTSYDHTFRLTVVESTKVETLRAVFGDDNVSKDGGNITVRHNKKKLPRASFVIDHAIDQGLRRHAIEVGMVTLDGEISHVHTGIVEYALNIDTYPGSDGNNVLEYIATIAGGAATSKLQIATEVLKAGTVGAEYSAKVLAVGGAEPYSFAVDSGELPAGLELAADGTISGTPTAEGSKTFSVKVTDNKGASAVRQLSINVNAE